MRNFSISFAYENYGLKKQANFKHVDIHFVDPETGVSFLDEEVGPVARVQLVLECLMPYDPTHQSTNGTKSMPLYWTIRDYAHAYRSGSATPSVVSPLRKRASKKHILIVKSEK